MKKKSIVAAFVLVLGTLAIVLPGTFGRKPFGKLSADEVMSVELFIIPPEKTINITDKKDISELMNILNEIVIYQEDNSGHEYAGQLVQVTITLKNGKTHVIGAYNPFLFLNNKCYRTKYEPCERLNAYGNRILNEQ
jgi:hypothetical protein